MNTQFQLFSLRLYLFKTASKALLKRLWIVANSMLVEEIIRDLQFVQTHLGQNPELDLNRRERAFLSALCSYAAEKGYTEISQLSKSILRC